MVRFLKLVSSLVASPSVHKYVNVGCLYDDTIHTKPNSIPAIRFDLRFPFGSWYLSKGASTVNHYRAVRDNVYRVSTVVHLHLPREVLTVFTSQLSFQTDRKLKETVTLVKTGCQKIPRPQRPNFT